MHEKIEYEFLAGYSLPNNLTIKRQQKPDKPKEMEIEELEKYLNDLSIAQIKKP